MFWGPHQAFWLFMLSRGSGLLARLWLICWPETLMWEVFGKSGSTQLHLWLSLEWALRMDFASQDPGLLLSVIWPSLLWTLLHASLHFLHPAVCRPGTQEMPNVREFYGWFTAVLTLKGGFKRLTNFPSKSLQTFPAPESSMFNVFFPVSKNKILGASLVAHW